MLWSPTPSLRRVWSSVAVSFALFACADDPPLPPNPGPPLPGDEFRYVDLSGENLPEVTQETACLDATFFDANRDGHLDVFIGNELRQNVLLLNDGTGKFVDATDRLPRATRDSEDVAVLDADGDGDDDLLIVSEDDQVNELYINDGSGRFVDASDRIPVTGISNAVASGDIDGDGDLDFIIGNNGPSFVLTSDSGALTDATMDWLSASGDVTQDVELADLDGDSDLDAVFANENLNRVVLNDGNRFVDGPALPSVGDEESRDVDVGDVDGDGDLDLFFGNVSLFGGASAQNRLLLNDGTGTFSDASMQWLPDDIDNTMDGDFVDLDGDGDLDLATANYGDEQRGRALTPYRIYINEDGRFTDQTARFFPDGVTGHGFDLEIGDLNGDGVLDFYLCSGRSLDRLVISLPVSS